MAHRVVLTWTGTDSRDLDLNATKSRNEYIQTGGVVCENGGVVNQGIAGWTRHSTYQSATGEKEEERRRKRRGGGEAWGKGVQKKNDKGVERRERGYI